MSQADSEPNDCGFVFPSITSYSSCSRYRSYCRSYEGYVKINVCLNGTQTEFQHKVSVSGWHKISVSQNKKFQFEVAIDDVTVTSEKNTMPERFEKVDIYLSGANENAYQGSVKNLKITDNF